MYTQRQRELRDTALGFGEGSIWNYGCKLVALSYGLKKFGIDLPPIELNSLLKTEGLFTGTTKNLINDALIHKLPFIESFQRINAFSMEQLAELLKAHVVIGEVSPVPIGGTGQHFVLVLSIEGANAIIGDPWWGDELKVAERYSKHGNIKSLRVYKVKPENKPIGGQMQIDSKVFEELVSKSSKYDEFIKIGYSKPEELKVYVDDLKQQHQQDVNKIKDLEQKLEAAEGSVDPTAFSDSLALLITKIDGIHSQIPSLALKSQQETIKKAIDDLRKQIEDLEPQQTSTPADQVPNQGLIQTIIKWLEGKL